MSVATIRPAEVREQSFARCLAIASPPLPTIDRLSAREIEVLRAVCRHGHEDGAQSLFIEIKTVKELLRSIYRKLGIAEHQGNQGKIGRACYQLGKHDQPRGDSG